MWIQVLAFIAGLLLACLWWQRLRHRHTLQQQRQEEEGRLRQTRGDLETRFQARQTALFDSMAEGVLILDAQGRIELFNQSLGRLFPPARDIRGQSLMEAFRLPELDALADRLLKETASAAAEIELPGPPPGYIQANGATVRDPEGNPRGAILVFHDLTRIRQLENTRQEFVANVSHELRTPLSLIKGYVETLLEGAKDDPAVQTRFLQTINKHTDRLIFLIEDLLDISQLESGQAVFNPQLSPVRETVARVLEDLTSRADACGITLDNQVPGGLMAYADTDRLQQVLFNLLDNAIKYGRPEGRVVAGAKLTDGRLVQVWLQDDGPGIPPEARERIFERFFRVEKARSREQGGTGLGLAIVKHIVQGHGGRVWVESEPGKGTIFFFTLPAGK